MQPCFKSGNDAGVHPRDRAALAAANDGPAPACGAEMEIFAAAVRAAALAG